MIKRETYMSRIRPFIGITMPTALLSAQIEMKESRQTVAFLVKLDLRRKHTTTHGEVSRRLLPELKTVSESVLEPPVQAQISGAASPYTKDCINNQLIAWWFSHCFLLTIL